MMIVAHPDDEDGALLTYLSRGLGVRATLLTLTRGEGGQNAMSAESYDALGIIRTNELLKADQYYGAKQLWGTEVDFGFSKTQEESFQKWGHDRVLYDAVLAVRSERPQVIVSTFVGGITDGHGQHQVSGEIAQEVFKAAADPKRLSRAAQAVSEGGLGLQPWQPLAVYSHDALRARHRQGHVRLRHRQMGARQISQLRHRRVDQRRALHRRQAFPSARGTRRSAAAMCRSRAKAGASRSRRTAAPTPPSAGPRPRAITCGPLRPQRTTVDATVDKIGQPLREQQSSTSTPGIAGLAQLAGITRTRLARQRPARYRRLHSISSSRNAPATRLAGRASARADLPPDARSSREDCRQRSRRPKPKQTSSSNSTPKSINFRPRSPTLSASTSSRSAPTKPTPKPPAFAAPPPMKLPPASLPARNSASASTPRRPPTQLASKKSGSRAAPAKTGRARSSASAIDPAAPVADPIFTVHVADNAAPTAPFFTRPNTEQPYYDISNPQWRERSFAPYPARRLGGVHFRRPAHPHRQSGADAAARHRPRRLLRTARRHARHRRQRRPGGAHPPPRWQRPAGPRHRPHPGRRRRHRHLSSCPMAGAPNPAQAEFHRKAAGDTEPILFSVTPVRRANRRLRHQGHRAIRRPQLTIPAGTASAIPACVPTTSTRPPTPDAQGRREARARPAHRLRHGTGDLVPEAIEGMGITPASALRLRSRSGDLAHGTSSSSAFAPTPSVPNWPKSSRASTSSSATAERSIVQYQSNTSLLRCRSPWAHACPSAWSTSRLRSSCSILPTLCSISPTRSPPPISTVGRRARPLLPRYLGSRIHRSHRNRRPRPGSAARRLDRHPSRQGNLYICRLRALSPVTRVGARMLIASSPTC